MGAKASIGEIAIGIALVSSIAALVGLDQGTKRLAESALAGAGERPFLGHFAVLTYTRNSGAFLSLGAGLPAALKSVLLVALPFAVLAFLALAFLRRRGRPGEDDRAGSRGPRAPEIAAALLLVAGGLGNLIDRVASGSVRDFLYFSIGGLKTGIMNLADLYILAALILIVATALRARSRAAPS
jgi:signal peptidase II